MHRQHKEKIITAIQEEIAKTAASILAYQKFTKPIAPENAIGRVSRMYAINNKSVNDAALRKAEIKLSNLKISLSNIDDQEFELCSKCQNEIPIGRILLVPHSRFCLRCAS